MIQTPHINSDENAFAKTVLMPGDPLRAKYVAENFLENPVLVNNVRGVQGYTGTYEGKTVSVMASGMGCPSIGIYSHELFTRFGVENIIRIGSAGAISPKLKIRDIVVALSAFTDSGYVRSFGFQGNVAPCCSYDLLRRAMDSAAAMNLRAFAGPVFSSDAFYSDVDTTTPLQRLGVLAVEMETAALYMNAARAGKNALTICTISDSLVTGEETTAQERQEGFTAMMKLALSIA
ncbi:MAG: purine-nucleoside phosphorylase [Clostridiales bacterium]|nr:purine-nucleoside phosphorylase [Clostridiales bacterium]